MSFIVAAPVVSSADEMLAVAQQLLDDETARLYANDDVAVSCQPNCNACCNHAVVVTDAESRAITAAVRELPATTQKAIANRADAVADRLVAEGLGDGTDTLSQSNFPRSYYALVEPCPLLIDGQCAVRSQRPLVCRDYLVSSDPKACWDPSLEHLVRIRRRNDVFAGFRAVSVAFDEPRRRLLINALRVAAPPATTGRRSGPRLARLLQSS